jgi:DNA-binding beta-propeller fold protein YncE
VRILLSLLVSLFLIVVTVRSHAETSTCFSPVASVPLPNVEGRIDHLGIDVPNGRLFVSALGNNSLEIVDLRTSSVVHSIARLQEPQGVCYTAESNKLYVTNAGSGLLNVYDGTSFRLLRQVDLGGDADNIHPDLLSHRILISAGNGISVVDTADMSVSSISLPGHPEGFALEPNGPRVFVNVPLPSRSVFVVDRAQNRQTGRWSVGGPFADMFSNFPISLDDAHQRLFVGTRVPAGLKVLDTSSGRVVADLRIDKDADDVFYDAKRQRVYVSCGEGFLDVFQQEDADHYAQIARIPTAPGARTSLWVPEMDRFFVAVPHRDSQQAEIRVFDAE